MPLDAPDTTTGMDYANFIPPAVRRQAERADELARQLGMGGASTDTTAEDTTVVTDPPAPAPDAPPPPVDDWEQRYRTLQGKYDSEVPGLRAQLQGMERVIAAMNVAPPAPAAAPAAAPPSATTTVVPREDTEAFGEDLIAAARRWARVEVDAELSAMRAKLSELEGNFGTLRSTQQGTVVQTARQAAMAGLDHDPEIGATWRATNEEPAFITWLQLVDPFSQQQRMRLLREAFDAGDTTRMKAFFKAYATEHTVTQVQAPASAHTPGSGTGAPTLEDLAAPGRASGPAPAGAPGTKRTWSRQDIQAFYRDVQRGKFNGREAERLRAEQDILAAVTEGRIR